MRSSLLIAQLGLASCGPSSEESIPPAAPQPSGHSILLVTLDTTRTDALGCYGGGSSSTPVLDRLATQSLLFENAYSVAPLTLPSHCSMLTGEYPFQHGVRDNVGFALPEEASTLAERLQKAGYETAAFVACVVLGHHTGMAQGFEVFEEPVAERDAGPVFSHIAAPEVNAAFQKWFQGRSATRPFFAWVHYYDPHMPYEPPAEFVGRTGSAYGDEVAAMDAALGQLLESVEHQVPAEELLTVVVSDHGEALGFRGEISHSIYVYEPLLRIPFLIRLPGNQPQGSTRSDVASQVDLPATILTLLGIDPEEAGAGRSLTTPKDDDRYVYFESYYPYLQHHWSPLAGLVGQKWKYIHSTQPELYELAVGEAAHHDQAATQLEVRDQLHHQLQGLVQNLGSGAAHKPIDAQTLAQLQSLGYTAVQSEQELPDLLAPPEGLASPATNGSLIEKFYEATVPGRGWTQEKGILTLQKLISADPNNVGALHYLSVYLIQAQRYDEAEAPLEKLLQLRPRHGPAWANLGAVLQHQRKIERAVSCYEMALQLEPDTSSVLYNLAACLQHLGRSEEAQETRKRLRALR